MILIGRLAEQDMVKAYQECDAVLLLSLSRTEGFGYVALEAMACGKQVIASNNSALPEIVLHGVTGILCDTNNVEAFVHACRFFKDDFELCTKMANAARARAVKHFSVEILSENYTVLIHRLVMS